MTLSLSNLRPAVGSAKRKKRVGRGNASNGTYSGRGMKGQRARSGGSHRLKMKGLKARLQKVPKLRGFRSHYGKAAVVNLTLINHHFAEGEEVTPAKLKQLRLVDKIEAGVKILGTGQLTKKLTFKGCQVSQSVRLQVAKAGGKIL